MRGQKDTKAQSYIMERKSKQVMVIHFTNINKTSNHLSSQLNSLNTKKTMTEIQVLLRSEFYYVCLLENY